MVSYGVQKLRLNDLAKRLIKDQSQNNRSFAQLDNFWLTGAAIMCGQLANKTYRVIHWGFSRVHF